MVLDVGNIKLCLIGRSIQRAKSFRRPPIRVTGESLTGQFASKVLRTVEGSLSVRTTIPEAVAAILGVRPGSVLVWTVEPGTGKVCVSADSAKKSSKRG
jgi:hypothetical protein